MIHTSGQHCWNISALNGLGARPQFCSLARPPRSSRSHLSLVSVSDCKEFLGRHVYVQNALLRYTFFNTTNIVARERQNSNEQFSNWRNCYKFDCLLIVFVAYAVWQPAIKGVTNSLLWSGIQWTLKWKGHQECGNCHFRWNSSLTS